MGLSWSSFGKVFGLQAMLKPVSSVASGRPRAVSNYFWGPQDCPRPLQEPSKSSPRPLQEAFSRPRSSKRPLGSHLGSIWTPFWTPFGRKNHLHEVFRRQSAVLSCIQIPLQQARRMPPYVRAVAGTAGRHFDKNCEAQYYKDPETRLSASGPKEFFRILCVGTGYLTISD